jgi:hypothetical protein
MSSRTTPYEIETIPRYPETLQIYRIRASKFYQVRLFVDRKYVRRSTRCIEKPDAIEFAKRFYDEIRIAQRLDENVHTDTFAACAKHLSRRQESLINQSQRSKKFNNEDLLKLDKDILPYFQTMSVSRINTAIIEDYIDNLTSERKLSPSTLSKHIIIIRKVLKEAMKRDYIKTLPMFPIIKKRDNPRSYFNEAEYKQLRETAKRLSKENIKVRYIPLTEEIYDFIIFHVNVFVRPSDIKLLKHKHVEVVNNKQHQYLLITPPNSKTSNRQSASMKTAVIVYERLKRRHDGNNFSNLDDYVFFPQYQNRDYALQTIRRQFDFILDTAKLKYDRNDKPRTIYSLRHTALMFRILKSENIDIFMLARNALTSVEMLERFYLSHAESRLKIENLQQFA